MLVFPAELTHSHADACMRMLVQALRAETGTHIVADATPLQRFDSSALAVLMACRRAVLAQQKTLAVRGLPGQLRELAALYGVAELLPVAH